MWGEEETFFHPQGSLGWFNRHETGRQEKMAKFNYICVYENHTSVSVRDPTWGRDRDPRMHVGEVPSHVK